MLILLQLNLIFLVCRLLFATKHDYSPARRGRQKAAGTERAWTKRWIRAIKHHFQIASLRWGSREQNNPVGRCCFCLTPWIQLGQKLYPVHQHVAELSLATSITWWKSTSDHTGIITKSWTFAFHTCCELREWQTQSQRGKLEKGLRWQKMCQNLNANEAVVGKIQNASHTNTLQRDGNIGCCW